MLFKNDLNSATADALCTVITLGFLSLDNRRDVKSNFLYEHGAAASDHIRLCSLMRASGINELLDLMTFFEISMGKHGHPFIYAKRNGFDDAIAQIRIDETLSDFIDELEEICNTVFPDLRGAYVGGVAEENVVRLLFPSLIYQYQIPNYIDTRGQYLIDANINHRKFCDVTEKVLELFSNLMPLAENTKIQFWSTENDLRVLAHRMNKNNLQANRLFASVHGLVTSMTLAPPNELADGNYNVELALSGGTTKIASCIPCAIFAMSQGAPASFTHFGRGDYWNLPEDCNAEIRYNWEIFINNCYAEGMNILSEYLHDEWRDFFQNLSIENENGNFSYIPDVFLSALTFEGSFISKMTNVLGVINTANGRE